MTPELEKYLEVERQWIALRDRQDVTESRLFAEDLMLDALDNLYYQLSLADQFYLSDREDQ